MLRLLFFLGITTLGLSIFSVEKPKDALPTSTFSKGEKLSYRVHYGLINAAEANMTINNDIHEVNGKPCYKIDVEGKSTGFFRMLYTVDDIWGTYLDTASIVPQQFYRYIRENKYRKNEIVNFDQTNATAETVKLHKKSKEVVSKVKHDVPSQVQDMVSGYYYLRTLDFDNITVGEVIKIDAFFDKEVYDFEIKYLGKEKVNTRLGQINALVLQPVLPDNKVFRGENAIKCWISDDRNRIPLKIKAEMFIGAVEIDIKNADNILYPINKVS